MALKLRTLHVQNDKGQIDSNEKHNTIYLTSNKNKNMFLKQL